MRVAVQPDNESGNASQSEAKGNLFPGEMEEHKVEEPFYTAT